MAKSLNISTPGTAFPTQHTAVEPAVEEKPVYVIPEGYELRPALKNRRLNLLLRSSTYEKLYAFSDKVNHLAGEKVLSVNELINRLIDENLEQLDAGELAVELFRRKHDARTKK